MRPNHRIDGGRPEYSVNAMTGKDGGGHAAPMPTDQDAEPRRDDAWIAARKKLIDGIIANNQLQLRNECARGGAEIERECALRDAARAGAGPDARAELERVNSRMEALQQEQQRLIVERDWLDGCWRELENGRAAEGGQPLGQA
jgi:hypothetical protein